MNFVETRIHGAFEVRHEIRSDARGRFSRLYCEREFAEAGLNTSWVQANHSVTIGIGSIRGMHFQRPPAAEAKLVSCPVGKAFDVAVDLRMDSPTFLQWVAVEIDETTSFYIPEGCAHGFQAQSAELHMIYQHGACYDAQFEGGIRFDDPALNIAWPLPLGTISDRDRSFPLIDSSFEGIRL